MHLATDRLLLRPLTLDDVDAFTALHADPELARYVHAYTYCEAEERLRVNEQQWTDRGHGLFAVLHQASEQFLGRCGLQYWPRFDEVEIAWTLRSQVCGGAATPPKLPARAWIGGGLVCTCPTSRQ